MSQFTDTIFSSVCLDERITDGIFRMDEDSHMAALRDHFVKRGLTLEDAISVSNQMLEGRFPERQAYNKDGILVTFPTPKHKAKAIAAGTHFEKNPNPQATAPAEPPPESKEPMPKGKSGGEEKEEPSGIKPPGPQSVFQGGQELSIEPVRGAEKPESPPTPPIPPVVAPVTPERKAAEKAVVQQMIQGDEINRIPESAGNSELENNIKIMRNTIMSVIDSLPYPKLEEAYTLITSKYLYAPKQ